MNSKFHFTIESAVDLKAIADHFYLSCGSAGVVDPTDTLVSAFCDNEMVGNVRLCFEQGHFVLRKMKIEPEQHRVPLSPLKTVPKLKLKKKPDSHEPGFFQSPMNRKN